MWAVSEQTKKRNICSTLSRDLIRISKRCCTSVTKAEIPRRVFQKLTATLATNLAGADLTNLWGFFLAGVGFPDLGTDQGLRDYPSREMNFPTVVVLGTDPRVWVSSHQAITSLDPKQWANSPDNGSDVSP